MSLVSLDDPDLPLDVLLTEWPQMIPVFVRHRMLCVGCLISPFHTITDACAEYHLDEAAFRGELSKAVETV